MHFLKNCDLISQGNSTDSLTYAIEPPHPVVQKLEMLFQLFRLDLFSECPSRKRPARMRDLENLQSHPLLPIRRQDGDPVREVVIAESPVARRKDVLPRAPDFHAIAEVLAHRVVVGREAERDAVQPIFVFGVGMVAVMYVHDPAAIEASSSKMATPVAACPRSRQAAARRTGRGRSESIHHED